uniref:Histidine kinase HAMP region domain protein n=1 Tax=Chondromyces catenulatus TaxID=1653841 RepID=A0A3S7UZF8_9BACT|nr:histidine kinase HAMP region domain protein [Chondromyces catenulatus]
MKWTLSWKILVSISGLLLACSVVVAALTYVQTQRSVIEEHQGIVDIMNYTFETLLSQDALPSLQRVVENSATVGGVREVVIVARDGDVIASSDRLAIGKPSDSPLVQRALSLTSSQRATHMLDDALILLQPLRGSRFMGGAAGDIVGVVQVTVARENIDQQARAAALQLLTISFGSYAVIALVLVAILRALVTKPVHALAALAARLLKGDRSQRSRIQRRDEIGVLSAAFDAMADEVDGLLSGLEGQVAARTRDLEEERVQLERALKELEVSTEARVALAETVRALSTPVSKLYEGVLLMPIVGDIDAERAEQIQRSLLSGIEAHDAEQILLDLTGVATVDAEVAAGLLRAARAARLLGASVTLVGITARVAKSIVGLDIDLTGITTRADLQSGLVHALRSLSGKNGAVRKVSRPVPS